MDKKRLSRRTWLSPYLALWRKYHEGDFAYETSVKALKKVEDEIGAEEALERWGEYLGDVPPKYHSVHRFAERHGDYVWTAPLGPTGKPLATSRLVQ